MIFDRVVVGGSSSLPPRPLCTARAMKIQNKNGLFIDNGPDKKSLFVRWNKYVIFLEETIPAFFVDTQGYRRGGLRAPRGPYVHTSTARVVHTSI